MDLTSLHRFHIAPGYDPAAPDTWIWTDRSTDVNQTGSGSAVTITGGRADEVGDINPGAGVLQVNNAGGHYCTQNPLGRWYGLLARNCPARWGTISGAEAWATNTSNGWGTPDVGTSWSLDGTASDWSSSGGVGQVLMGAAPSFHQGQLVGADARNGEATFVCSVPVVATGAALVCSLSVRRTVGVSQILFSVDFGTGGVLGVRIKRDISGGISDIGGSSSVGSYSANQRIKARCQWDGQDLRLRVWPEASGEPTTWSTTATDSQCPGAAVAIHSWRVSGNSNAGSLTFSYDNLEIEAVEIVGTIPAFPVRWDTTATLSWAPLEIAGITRRLSQGSKPLRSPMYRLTTGYANLVGYWPMEDGSDADQLTNTVPGGQAGAVTNMQLGAAGPAGSAGAATFTNSDGTSKVQGAFKGASSTAGWQISWSTQLPALPASTLQMISWYTSNGYRWTINPGVGFYNVAIVDPTDTVVVNSNIGNVGTGDPNQWVTFRMKATVSGGTVTWAFAWFVQGAGAVWGSGSTFSGSLGALRSWSANGNASMGGAQICHVFGLTTANDNLQSYAALRAFDGYVNELAADRIARLCDEEGVPVAVEPGDSEPLGAQSVGDLLTLLRDAEAADLGVLYESGAGLGYRPRDARYNRPVAMTLAFTGSRDIGDAPEPTDDDQRVRNQWTVQRTSGSEAIYDDPAHIALNGFYPDSITINNAFDSRLIQIAAWRVHLGTWGEMRWPQIVISLTSQSDLLTAWRGRPFGARMLITGVPAQGPVGADVDLIVEGWQQDITSHTWVLTLNCSPARPWDVAVWGSTRYDANTTTLAGSQTTSSTSWGITTALDKEVWSTTAVPYDWMVAGERVAVTAITAASGTGPYTQTATVTRAVNSITKAHSAGEEIHLATPGPWAL